ncbi:putative non-specific serine/threonine protein kinase [Helianthus annuus]|nr:putative non-specific serine/threonine protein kinase [Helianthus annuus]KAJ0523501.1 putative non-specific serine/threonine protein kinase [Helianthus annuus]KAJ0531297.1 putative non-specific serine/threonine protein kinase [Helianthus annuus]KAJ0698133.1 putative non-specific serine/threonine protein kinase [Helianthus annuus]
MEDQSTHIFFFIIALILLLSDCTALDTISAYQEIRDGNTLVSEGGMFELGFFSPGKSKNRYVGYGTRRYHTVLSYGLLTERHQLQIIQAC